MSRPLAAASALGCLLVLAGCAPSVELPAAPAPATTSPAIAPGGQTSSNVSTAASPTPTLESVDARQQTYAATVATFPLPLPEGYAFPETAPTGGDGRTTAYRFWRCSVAQAARDAEVNDGDYKTAHILLAQIGQVSDAELPHNSEWVANVIEDPDDHGFNAALEGETGVCYFWLRPYGRWGQS